jgi:hypothetical protein
MVLARNVRDALYASIPIKRLPATIARSDRPSNAPVQPLCSLRTKISLSQDSSTPIRARSCRKIAQNIAIFSTLAWTFVLCAQNVAIGGVDIPMITIQSTDMGCTLSAH